MGEIIPRPMPPAPLQFTGERLTSELTGQTEIEHLHRYLLARDYCRGKDVVDVASGEGYGAALLAQVARTVIGIEMADDAVNHANMSYRMPNLRYLRADARMIPLDSGTVDVVVSFETIEHFAEQDRFLSEIRRVLRPGGLLIVSTPDRDNYSPAESPANPFHVLELTTREFEHLLARHFSQVSVLFQRPIYGSVLLPACDRPSTGTPLCFEKRGKEHFEGSVGLSRPQYIVAIASDVADGLPFPSVYIESGWLAHHTPREHAALLEAANREIEKLQDFARDQAAKRDAIEVLARDEIARRESAERSVATMTAQLQKVETDARDVTAALRTETARREHAEQEVVALTRSIREFEGSAREMADQHKKLEEMARDEIARREQAERAAIALAEQVRKVEADAGELASRHHHIEELARDEIRRRELAETVAKAAEHSIASISQRLEEFAVAVQRDQARAEDAEAKLLHAVTRMRTLEQLMSDEQLRHEGVERELTAGVHAIESTKSLELATMRAQLDAVNAQLRAILGSSIWRATWPVRNVASRMPEPLRRFVRNAATLTWWTLNLRLARRMAERRRSSSTDPSKQRTVVLAPPNAGASPGNDVPLLPPPGGCHPGTTFLRGFSDAAVTRAIRRLHAFPPFVPEYYLRMNPDVRQDGIDPGAHAICFGAFERRKLLSPEQIARSIGKLGGAEPPKTVLPIAEVAERIDMVHVYASSLGNVFMREIAESVVSDFRDHGIAAELRDETSSPADLSKFPIFVAPHEFFALGQGVDWVCDAVLADAFVLGTEQVQTKWFSEALPLVLLSRGIIDMSPQTTRLFNHASMPALHYLPNSNRPARGLTVADREHRLFRALPAEAKLPADPRTPFVDRQIDISFFGTQSVRRDRFFARNAAFLAEFNNFLYLRPEAAGPIKEDGPDASLTNIARHVSGHAKITLNIHRDEYGYFEWHRAVRIGMAMGSLLVTDPCLRSTTFIPGVHYLEENTRQIPNLLQWLLRSNDGQVEAERVRANALALVADADAARQNVAMLGTFLLECTGARMSVADTAR